MPGQWARYFKAAAMDLSRACLEVPARALKFGVACVTDRNGILRNLGKVDEIIDVSPGSGVHGGDEVRNNENYYSYVPAVIIIGCCAATFAHCYRYASQWLSSNQRGLMGRLTHGESRNPEDAKIYLATTAFASHQTCYTVPTCLPVAGFARRARQCKTRGLLCYAMSTKQIGWFDRNHGLREGGNNGGALSAHQTAVRAYDDWAYPHAV